MKEFDLDIVQLKHKVDILDQKFRSKWFPKKKTVEDCLDDKNSEDPQDQAQTKLPKDLINSVLLPDPRGIS